MGPEGFTEEELHSKGELWVKDHLETCLAGLVRGRQDACRSLLFKSLMPLSDELQMLFEKYSPSTQVSEAVGYWDGRLKEALKQLEDHVGSQRGLCSCMIEGEESLGGLVRRAPHYRSWVIKMLLFPLKEALKDLKPDTQAQVLLCRQWLLYRSLCVKHGILGHDDNIEGDFWAPIQEHLLMPSLVDAESGQDLFERSCMQLEWIWKSFYPYEGQLWQFAWKWTLSLCHGLIYYAHQERQAILAQYAHPIQEEKRLQLLAKCHHRLIAFQQNTETQIRDLVPFLSKVHLDALSEIFDRDCNEAIQRLIECMSLDQQ